MREFALLDCFEKGGVRYDCLDLATYNGKAELKASSKGKVYYEKNKRIVGALIAGLTGNKIGTEIDRK